MARTRRSNKVDVAVERKSQDKDAGKDAKKPKVEESASEFELSEEEKPKKKRAAKAKGPQKKKKKKLSQIKGKKGALEKALDLPPEVMLTIAQYLEHKDLWALSHVSNNFRSILKGAGADHIWHEAAAKAGLPKLTGEWTHFQLSNLLYSKECYACQHYPVQKRAWFARAVLCKRCLAEETVSTSTMPGKLKLAELHPMTMIAMSSNALYPRTYTLLRYVKQVDAVLSAEYPRPSKTAKVCETALMFKEADWPAQPYEKVHNLDTQRWEDVQGPMTRQAALVKSLQSKYEIIRKDGILLDGWEQGKRYVRNEELYQVRAQRRRDIEDRLLQHGWTREDFDTTWAVRAPAIVNQSVPLTDRAFETMLPILTEWVAEVRPARLHRQQQAREKTLRRELSQGLYEDYLELVTNKNAIVLPVNLFLNMSAVKRLWKGQQELDIAGSQDETLAEAMQITEACQRDLISRIVQAHAQAKECRPDLSLGSLPSTMTDDNELPPADKSDALYVTTSEADCRSNGLFLRSSMVVLHLHEHKSLKKALVAFQSNPFTSSVWSFDNFVEHYRDTADKEVEFVQSIIKVQPSDFIISKLISDALEKLPEAAASHVDTGLSWKCESCNRADFISDSNLARHILQTHLYAQLPFGDRPKTGDPDNLVVLKEAVLPRIVAERVAVQPAQDGLMTFLARTFPFAGGQIYDDDDDDGDFYSDGW